MSDLNKLTLTREDYEKSKDLFELQYLEWDAKKNIFVNTSKKNLSFSIEPLDKMHNKKKDELKTILNSWEYTVTEKGKNIENTDNYKFGFSAADVSRLTAEQMAYFISTFKDDKESKKSYLCSSLMQKDTYLSIGIFSIPKNKKSTEGILEISLEYPNFQYMPEKRKHGTLGACDHNNIVRMIRHIFSNDTINKIHSEPISSPNKAILKKLGFTESKSSE